MSRKSKEVGADDLHPDIAAGLTIGASAEEALQEHPVRPGDARDVVKHMRDADRALITRDGGVPFAPFVAASDTKAVWTDGVTDRPQMDVVKTYTKLGLGLLREGRQCLRCDEPHPEPFPELCDLCGYPMKERQIMDIAVEFDGERHLGPSAPISQYLAEQDERVEKAKFDQKIREGKQGKL